MRVLIVEDQALLALALELDLLDDGHEVVGTAARRDIAVALARDHSPDLALVDLQLADGDTGVHVAREIASERLRVVFVTGRPDLIPEGGCGGTGVLYKPYAPSVLRATLAFVAHLLGVGERAEPPRELRLFA